MASYDKSNYSNWEILLIREIKELLSLIAIVFIAVLIHEIGHYVLAYYYNLNPDFGVNKNAFYVVANKAEPEINWVIDRAGPIANILSAFLALFLREYLIITQKKVPLFIITFIASNIVISFIALLMFPHS